MDWSYSPLADHCTVTYKIQRRLLNLIVCKLGRFWLLRDHSLYKFKAAQSDGQEYCLVRSLPFLQARQELLSEETQQVLFKKDILWLAGLLEMPRSIPTCIL